MGITRTRLESCELQRGQRFEGIVLSHVDLVGCWSAWGPPDAERPVFQDVSVTDLRLSRVTLGGAVLRDVTVDGLRSDNSSMFFFGNELERVTLRGKVGTVILDSSHTSAEYELAYSRVIAAAEREVDWTLDISEAMGEVVVRGYAADRIRRDPSTQVVVRRPSLLDGRWRSVDIERTTVGVTLDLMVRAGWPDTVITADATRRNYRSQLRVLQRLRDEGIADLA